VQKLLKNSFGILELEMAVLGCFFLRKQASKSIKPIIGIDP
jgi:hypothetical protein